MTSSDWFKYNEIKSKKKLVQYKLKMYNFDSKLTHYESPQIQWVPKVKY